MHAELFKKTKLIICDEVPMQHRHCVEAVDRTLQDMLDNSKPFGGITVVLGGDFRQILPVIPKGVREQIVGACLRRSTLWRDIDVLILDLNMRLNNIDSDQHFIQFLTEVIYNLFISLLFLFVTKYYCLFLFALGWDKSTRTY